MIRICWTVLATWLFCATLLSAQEREYFLAGPTTQTYAVILAGPSAEKTYENQIHSWAIQLYDVLIKDYGYNPDQMILLMNGVDSREKRITASCRRDVIREKLKTLINKIHPGDQLFFFFIGHGTSNEEEAKFVLTGPDISGREFAALLQPFSTQDIVVVNATSASLPFCTALTAPGRVIVSATRSRAEKYNTIFAQYFIAALDANTGDRDKNQRVSIWEAFIFATKSVEKWYVDQNRIPTEHAVLEDNGDGIFSLHPGSDQNDGSLAQIAYLNQLAPARATGNTSTAGDVRSKLTLNAKIRELERSVFLLRHRKADLPEKAYQQEMEKLLVELARTSRQLRQMDGAGRPQKYEINR